MDEFSLLEHFFDTPEDSPSAGMRGLSEATVLAEGQTGEGLVVVVDGQAYDLGGHEDSVTLADAQGLSIYADLDGDGTVDHVTTVRFDGTWQSWALPEELSQQVASSVAGTAAEAAVSPAPSAGAVGDAAAGAVGDAAAGAVGDAAAGAVAGWDAYCWESDGRGNWP